MLLTSLLSEIARDEQFAAIVAALGRAQTGETFTVESVPQETRPVVIAALARALDRPLLVVASRQDAAARLHDSLACYLAPGDELLLWPAQDALPYEQLRSTRWRRRHDSARSTGCCAPARATARAG